MGETLKVEKPKRVDWEYDEESDVLYVSFGKPKEALTMDMGSGILARYDKDSYEMVGFTIVGLKAILGKAVWEYSFFPLRPSLIFFAISFNSRLKSFISPKSLSTSGDIIIYTEFNGGTKMATFTVSAPKELEELKKKYPTINWNEVAKQGILKKLEELKKFEELKKKGVI